MLIQQCLKHHQPVAVVCHAAAVLLNVNDDAGQPIVMGCSITGFSNSEEAAVGLSDIVPFLLEDELIAKGAKYKKVDDWHVLVVQDGLLISGQNPASSEATAKKLLASLM